MALNSNEKIRTTAAKCKRGCRRVWRFLSLTPYYTGGMLYTRSHWRRVTTLMSLDAIPDKHLLLTCRHYSRKHPALPILHTTLFSLRTVPELFQNSSTSGPSPGFGGTWGKVITPIANQNSACIVHWVTLCVKKKNSVESITWSHASSVALFYYSYSIKDDVLIAMYFTDLSDITREKYIRIRNLLCLFCQNSFVLW